MTRYTATVSHFNGRYWSRPQQIHIKATSAQVASSAAPRMYKAAHVPRGARIYGLRIEVVADSVAASLEACGRISRMVQAKAGKRL